MQRPPPRSTHPRYTEAQMRPPRRPRRRDEGSNVLAYGAAAAVALMGVSALYSHRRGRMVSERLYPPFGRFVSVEGVRLHYIERGRADAPPLLLVHGNGTSIEDFELSGLLDRLSADYRCIVVDRPGFGHSERPRTHVFTPRVQARILAGFLRRIGVGKALVLGHSFGALVTLALALDHPDRVAGIVLASGYFFPEPRVDLALFSIPALPIAGDVWRYVFGIPTVKLIGPKIVRKLFEPRAVPERFWSAFPLEYAERPTQVRASAEESAFLASSARKMRERYPSLSVPVVAITGEEDRVVGHEVHAERLTREIPHAELRLLPGLGHMIHYFAHDDIADAVDRVAERSGIEREPGEAVDPLGKPGPVTSSVLHAHGVQDR